MSNEMCESKFDARLVFVSVSRLQVEESIYIYTIVLNLKFILKLITAPLPCKE